MGGSMGGEREGESMCGRRWEREGERTVGGREEEVKEGKRRRGEGEIGDYPP